MRWESSLLGGRLILSGEILMTSQVLQISLMSHCCCWPAIGSYMAVYQSVGGLNVVAG